MKLFNSFRTLLAAALCCLLAAGCAGHVPYETLSSHLSRGECGAASALMAESRGEYGDNSALLFLLDSAMVHMRCREFEAAQEKFRAAEDLAGNLWTLSLSREFASYLTNDYVLEYAGEDFERAMIHLMSALAYLDEGYPEEALVECRRLDSLLSMYNDKYEEKNVYKEDAFGRYLSGILREGDNDPDGAFIDYKKALETYGDYGEFYGVGAPENLKADLFRVAALAGRLFDARELLPEYSLPAGQEDAGALGQVVWIHLRGRVPEKQEDRISIYTPHGPLTIAFPRYARPEVPEAAPVLVLKSGGESVRVRAGLVSDIGAIAVKNLEDRRVRITAKAVARAAAKQAVIREVAKNDDKEMQRMVENILNLFNTLLEQADLRSWQSLPGQVYMARSFLPPGEWHAALRTRDREIRKKVLVKAGQINYIVVNDALGRAFQ